MNHSAMTYISGSDSNVLSLRLPPAVFHSILFYFILLLVSLQNARWIQLQKYAHAHILCHPSIHFCSHFLVCLHTHKYAIFFSPSLPYAQIVSTGMHRHTQTYSSFFLSIGTQVSPVVLQEVGSYMNIYNIDRAIKR